MKKIKISLLFFIAFSFTSIAQSEIDSSKLKAFWKTHILPLANKDTVKLKSIINTPLLGEWKYFMELDKLDSTSQVKLFYKKIDLLITPSIQSQLKSQSYKNIDIYNHGNYKEILVSVDTSSKVDGHVNESGIIFRYKLINGVWKLYVIQGVG